jgi:hypothetical protein
MIMLPRKHALRDARSLWWAVILSQLCGLSIAYAQESEEAAASDAEPLVLGLKVVPRVLLGQAFTDNIGLTATGQQSEQITEISPGIYIASDKGRLTGHLDYALRGIAYGQLRQANSFRNSLDMIGKYEAVEGLLYLDFSGAILQQAINAFGTQSTSASYSTVNKAEVSNYSVSPHLQGRMGDAANYVVRVTRLVTQSDSATAPGTSTTQGAVNLDGHTPLRNVGWLVDLSRTGVDYSAGRYTEADVSDIGLSYALTPQLSIFAKVGNEANNYTSLDKQSYATNDFGVKWRPTEHTRLSVTQGSRSFGDYHAVSFEQSTGLVVVRLSDTRDVSATPTLVPSAINGFAVSALSVQRRQDLELILRGVRDTLTLAATQSESARVDTLSTALDDLARATVRQVGARVGYSHRLTPVFNLGFFGTLQRTWGDAGLPENWLREFSVSLTGRVTRRSALAFGLRHTGFTGTTPYEENALTFSWTVEF